MFLYVYVDEVIIVRCVSAKGGRAGHELNAGHPRERPRIRLFPEGNYFHLLFIAPEVSVAKKRLVFAVDLSARDIRESCGF